MPYPAFTAQVVLRFSAPDTAELAPGQTVDSANRQFELVDLEFAVVARQHLLPAPSATPTGVSPHVVDAAKEIVSDPAICQLLTGGDYVRVMLEGELDTDAATNFERDQRGLEVVVAQHRWERLAAGERDAQLQLEQQIAHLAAGLEPAFDEDTNLAGLPVSRITLVRVARFLNGLPSGIPQGHAATGLDGSVGLFWTRGKSELYVDFRADGRTRYYFDNQAGSMVERIIAEPHDAQAILDGISAALAWFDTMVAPVQETPGVAHH